MELERELRESAVFRAMPPDFSQPFTVVHAHTLAEVERALKMDDFLQVPFPDPHSLTSLHGGRKGGGRGALFPGYKTEAQMSMTFPGIALIRHFFICR